MRVGGMKGTQQHTHAAGHCTLGDRTGVCVLVVDTSMTRGGRGIEQGNYAGTHLIPLRPLANFARWYGDLSSLSSIFVPSAPITSAT